VTTAYWNHVAAGWAEGRDRLWRAHSDAVNVALCRRWLTAGKYECLLKTDLFDEATGLGLWPALVDLAGQVHAIDMSHDVATRGRTRHPALSAAEADVRRLPFADGVFDAVVSNSTLDHFDHQNAIVDSLRELHRVLARGGRLILTLDNGANPAVAVRNILPQNLLVRTGVIPYRMGATFGPAQATTTLRQLGFRVIETTAIVHCPRVVAVPALRVLDRLTRRDAWKRRALSAVGRFEAAGRWPTRFRTGHFVAVLGEKT